MAHVWPIVRRGFYAAGAIVAWLPLYAIFDLPTSLLTRVVAVAFALFAAVKPASALLVVAAFVMIAEPAAAVLSTGVIDPVQIRGAEALVLAFLGGWCVAAVLGRRPIVAAGTWLTATTAVFTIVIAASVAVSLAGLQARTTFPVEYLRHTAIVLISQYLSDPVEFAPLMQGVWLLEGVALLIAARAACLENPRWRDACVRMLVIGGAAAGVLGIVLFTTKLLQNDDPGTVVRLWLLGLRFPAHVTDTNAAGSGFALTLMLAFALLGVRGKRFVWIAAIASIVGGFLLCASRSGLIASLTVAAAMALAVMRRRGAIDAKRSAWAAVAIVVVAAAILVVFAPQVMVGDKALTSLQFRWYFTQMSTRLIAEAPVFGVGLARFRELSGGYMNAVLLARYPTGENSHNYFMQVAAELGIVGLIPFAILVCGPIVRGVRALRQTSVDVVFAGIVGAALAFLITVFTGHPFLAPSIAFAFWIVLGLCDADSERRLAATTRGSASQAAIVVALALVVIAVSLPQRLSAELRRVDFDEVAYGVYNWEQSDAGFRFRWTGPHARFFVPGSARLVEIPMRALHFDPAKRETRIDIYLDGREANHVVLADSNWRELRLLIPPLAGRRFRRVDLTVSPTWSPAALTPASGDRRELGVIVRDLKITKNLEPVR